MKNGKLVQMYLYLTILIAINIHFVYSIDPGRASSYRMFSFSAANQAKKFCQNMNDEGSICNEAILPYFNERSEPKSSVIQYANFCRQNKVSTADCAGLIIHLNKYEWDMKLVPELFQKVNKYYLQPGNYRKICIFRHEWYDYLFGKFSLAGCADRFDANSPNLSQQDILNTWTIIETFKSWAIDQPGNKCGCADVLGIYYAYATRNKIDLKDLRDYFNFFCLYPSFVGNEKNYKKWVETIQSTMQSSLVSVRNVLVSQYSSTKNGAPAQGYNY